MKHLDIPVTPVLEGEDAVRALKEYISELEEGRGRELHEKQKLVMIGLAKRLLLSIEAETNLQGEAGTISHGTKRVPTLHQTKVIQNPVLFQKSTPLLRLG